MPMTTRENYILLAHKVFEKERHIVEVAREVNRARDRHAQAIEDYHRAVAKAYGCETSDLQFSHSMACFGTRLVMHCVWDLKSNPRWPLCIFCGAPRDGD